MPFQKGLQELLPVFTLLQTLFTLVVGFLFTMMLFFGEPVNDAQR